MDTADIVGAIEDYFWRIYDSTPPEDRRQVLEEALRKLDGDGLVDLGWSDIAMQLDWDDEEREQAS